MVPSASDLALLAERGRGVCLDLGTGSGSSARAMLDSSATVVVTVEPDPEWRGKHGITDRRLVEGPLTPLYGGFDFAFIDHFPLADRTPIAEGLAATGAEVVVDDAHHVRQPDGFHRHGDNECTSFWHFDPKGCSL